MTWTASSSTIAGTSRRYGRLGFRRRLRRGGGSASEGATSGAETVVVRKSPLPTAGPGRGSPGRTLGALLHLLLGALELCLDHGGRRSLALGGLGEEVLHQG